jgi:hypothetical protein
MNQNLEFILPVGVEISIREPEYSVGESESVVTVCVGIISGEAAIPLEAVLMTVSDGNAEGKHSIVLNYSKSSARVLYTCMCDHPIAENDFVSLTSTTLTLTGTDGENCSTISILDDSMVERNETFSVQLSTSNTAVDITQTSVMVTVIDDDAVTVGWSTPSYAVDESDALVTLCVEIIQGEIARPVIIFYSTIDSSALSNNYPS